MKLKIITIGRPKMDYAKVGWQEYLKRLEHFHKVEVIHLAEKYAASSEKILFAAGNSFKVALCVEGMTLSSLDLANFIKNRQLISPDVSFIVGGPDGLNKDTLKKMDFFWSLSKLTFPHDLAMVILLETLYRASTINAGMPYHK